MRFSSIEITNYRQYKRLFLRFKNGENDLQVIVGDNGTGKTNLLNAFTWCLYGTEPHLGDSHKDKGEPKLNKDVILEAVETGIGIEDVTVQIEIENDGNIIRVKRTVPFRINGTTSVIEKKAEEQFTVMILRPDGNSKNVAPDTCASYINRMLPESIREYFFFDGEQLNDYFSGNRNDAIRQAVHSISQIDSITQMKRRTETVARDLMKKAEKSSPDLSVYTNKIHEYEERYAGHIEAAEKARADADDLAAKIDELDANLRGLPEVEKLEVKRDSLKTKRKQCAAALDAAMEQYCAFAKSRYVDFSFYEAAKAAIDVIAAMEKDKQLPPAVDPTLLKSMLSAHMCEVCQRPLSETEEAHIKELLELYQVGTETSNILTNMRNELRNLIRRVEAYERDRDKIITLLDSARQTLDDTTNELNAVEEEIASCPNVPQVKLWTDQRKKFEAERDDRLSEIGKQESWATQFKNAAEKQKKLYAQAKRQQGLGDDFQLAGDFGLRAASILADVEKETIAETREMIEKETEGLFKGLVWKESKCDRIGLNANYQLSLYDKYGFSCAGTCSAAERALLALSFTLAMHSVSGFESPLFIDTPIARASGDNRANFAKTLAEVSKSKQLILTFTPDEYSEAIASVFDPIAASNLRLVMDESERIVTVKGGE